MKKDKIQNILIFLAIFIVVLSLIIIKPLGNLDEIWNYNFARNVADGLIPYKDFNMLQMPLLPLLCGIILKITTNQLFVMRILASILITLVVYFIYKLFNLLKIKKEVSLILTFFIGFLFKDILCIDYNWATLLVTLIIVYLEIKLYSESKENSPKKNTINFLIGILGGICLTLKQTSGILICTALLGNKLFFVTNKNEVKLYFKSFIFRLIGILIPTLIILIYLVLNNAFNDFISYTIKGASGFSNYISYRNLIHFDVVGILSVLIPISFIYAWYKSIIKQQDKNIYFLLVYGLGMFIICFPISDKIHFIIGSTPIIILILYELYNKIKIIYNKLIRENTRIEKILKFIITSINEFLIILLLVYGAFSLYKYFCERENFSNLEFYRYIPITSELQNRIIKVDDYILNNNKEVKILDASAAIYMIPINKYNKNYDMLLKGNIGENGEEKIINDIKKTDNIQYLLLKSNYSMNWQMPLDIINFVKKNKTKVDEITIFDIYE